MPGDAEPYAGRGDYFESLLRVVRVGRYTTPRAGRKRNTHDESCTAYQRRPDHHALDDNHARELGRVGHGLNLAATMGKIKAIQIQLTARAKQRPNVVPARFSEQIS